LDIGAVLLIGKFEELKHIKLIKEYLPIFYEGDLVDILVEYHENIPPKKALIWLDTYLIIKLYFGFLIDIVNGVLEQWRNGSYNR